MGLKNNLERTRWAVQCGCGLLTYAGHANGCPGFRWDLHLWHRWREGIHLNCSSLPLTSVTRAVQRPVVAFAKIFKEECRCVTYTCLEHYRHFGRAGNLVVFKKRFAISWDVTSCRMASFGTLRRVTLVRTDVSEEHSATWYFFAACVGC
jgi:hypothetical protein